MRYFVTVEGERFEVEVNADAIRLNGEVVAAEISELPGSSLLSLLLDGRSHAIAARRAGAGLWRLDFDAGPTEVEVLDRAGLAIRELVRKTAASRGPEPLRAPMPGMIVKVDVEPGDGVAAGQAIVVVEAMKMENELHAQGAGKVKKVHVAPGEPVEKDQILVEFAALEEEQADG